MIGAWSQAIGALPFEWAQYAFMRHALLAILLLAPLCGILGAMIVNHRMAFFADSIGHGALAGLAAGVLAGLADPGLALVLFAALFAVLLVALRALTAAATDTVIAVITAAAVAGGLVILSRGGGFARFTRYLIGDILAITPAELSGLALVLACVLAVWAWLCNRLLLLAVHPALGRTRGVNPVLTEMIFSVLVAVVIAVAIPWVGIFIISSLLVLPAAAARNLARRALTYHAAAVALALASGLGGLFLSWNWGTATGATIVLVAAGLYFLTLGARLLRN